jgi:hypothetical protein
MLLMLVYRGMVRPESDLYYMRMSAFTYLWPIMEF